MPDPGVAQTSATSVTRTPVLIPRSHEERENRYIKLHRVVLDTQATDSSGKPVKHLLAQNFTVLRDGNGQQLSAFGEIDVKKSDVRAHVIILLDSVNNSSRTFAENRQDIERFIKNRASRLNYPTSIGILSNTGIRLGNPVLDRDLLLEQLAKVGHGHPHGLSCADEENPNQAFLDLMTHGDVTSATSARQLGCLNRRFVASLLGLQHIAADLLATPGRKVLIWIGPGWPLLYNSEFRPDNMRIQLNFYLDLATISDALRQAEVTLDMVEPAELFHRTAALNDHDTAFINGVPNQREVSAGSLSLQALANQSGGQLHIDTTDTSASIDQCIADAESYYVLAFDSPIASQPEEYHSLEVKVDVPGISLRTRTVYYEDDWSP